MINLNLLDRYRVSDAPRGNSECGMFEFKLPDAHILCIAVADLGWDQVSVSLQHRTPTWAEMEYIKRLFFHPTECAMQLHPPIADYFDGKTHNGCETCLHLWRPHAFDIPRPPKFMVGGMSPEDTAKAAAAYRVHPGG
jgi:hypothetical protein